MTAERTFSSADTDPVQSIINDTVRKVFQQVAHIDLRDCRTPEAAPEKLYTVYTTFCGGYSIRFSFCAEGGLLRRIAEHMLGTADVTADDIEECAKEFINILCGHVVKSVFSQTRVAARFHAPYFVEGRYVPESDSDAPVITTHYMDERFDMAVLINDRFSSDHTAN